MTDDNQLDSKLLLEMNTQLKERIRELAANYAPAVVNLLSRAEAAEAKLEEREKAWLAEFQRAEKAEARADNTDCGKGWLSPEQAASLQCQWQMDCEEKARDICSKLGWLPPDKVKELRDMNVTLATDHEDDIVRRRDLENKVKVLVEALEVWKAVIALTPIPPRAITYEQGWRILDAVQAAAPLFNKALAAIKE